MTLCLLFNDLFKLIYKIFIEDTLLIQKYVVININEASITNIANKIDCIIISPQK